MKKKFLIVLLAVVSVLCLTFGLSACSLFGGVEDYTLSFQVDGEDYAQIKTNGQEVIKIPNDPEKDGYEFDGWYWDDGVWEKPFTANSLLDAPISSNMSVYAKFDVVSYPIIYEADGGTQSNPVSYTVEDSFALSDAAKEGYTFLGWYSDENYTTKVSSISAGSTGEITLYANYELISYRIAYENTKDVQNDNAVSYTIESDTIVLSSLTKEGYTFEGWYNGNVKVTEIPKGSTGNLTLTAKWSAIGYEIIYHGVTGATNWNPATYDVEDEPLSLYEASKAGYTFLGWYSDSEYSSKVEEISVGTAGDLHLYAKWEIIEYTATFKDKETIVAEKTFTVEDNSIEEPSVPEHTGYQTAWENYTLGTENIVINLGYTPISYTISYENTKQAQNSNVTTYTIESKTITLLDISVAGYTFEGWYQGEEKVTEIIAGSYGDITITAKWTAIEYTISYENTKGAENGNEVTYTIESETITLSDISVASYTFDGWYEGNNKVTEIIAGSYGDITLTAKWTAIEYTISYENTKGAENGNEVTYTIESETITLSDISVVGYTFDGWYQGEEKVTEITAGSYGDITLTAKWTAIEYTISYENTKQAQNSNVTTYTIESETITLSDISVVGYTFDGWYNGNNKVTEIKAGSYGNITLTAKWTAIEYTISYENTKGAENGNEVTYTIESETITLSEISVSGYTFDGWYQGEEKVTEIIAGSYGDITLTAEWTAIEYTITYMYDENIGEYAEGASNPATYTVEDEFTFTLLVNHAEGYISLGWYTAKNNGDGEKVDGISLGSTGNLTVYAHWGLEVYSITYYNTDGVTNTNATTYTIESETFTIADVSKVGYLFDGWYSDEELTQPANLTVTQGSYGDIAFYAKWTAIEYTISYALYGGSYEGTGNPETYTIESSFTLVSPVLSGYVFGGWYTASEGGNKVTAIAAGTTGNLTFYARWIHISTITFNSLGGSAVNSITAAAGSAISAPVAPEKDYYTFAGWYTDAACTNAYAFTVMPEEDITLYANWTAIEYSITYVLNGGTNASGNPVIYTVEDGITLSEATKTGYTFIGWFTDETFTSAVVTEIAVGTHGNITLYANYSINRYTITFESNGGTSISAVTQNYATEVTAPDAPAKNGYLFAGWYTDSTLKTAYTFSTMPAYDFTLYAKWSLATYQIAYHLDGGTNASGNPSSYTIEKATITLASPEKTGYTFEGWYSDSAYTAAVTQIASGSYGDIELFAKWNVITYTVTYVLADGAANGNITSYTIETDITTLEDALLSGYTFNGWYSDADYTQKITTVAGGEIGNLTLYGKFTANIYTVWMDGTEETSYTVTFDLNGASGTAPQPQTVTEASALTYPAIPARAGYLFGGWYINAECTGDLYDFTASLTKDVTLYAKWIECGSSAAISVGATATVALQGQTELYYTFVPLVTGNVTITTIGNYDTYGELYNASGVMLARDDDSGTDDNFLIVYNVTAGKAYTVMLRGFSSSVTGSVTLSIAGNTAVADGAKAQISTKTTATYGGSFALTVPAARDGYKFLGWADANGTLYTDASGASIKAWDKAENAVLYSVWEKMVYTVTFVTNGGSEVASVSLAFGERLDLNEYVTQRSGYTFGGWYLSASDSEAYEATTMPDFNVTLYAKWITFALGSIKYDTDKTAISVYDTIDETLFNAICIDTDGNLATFTVTVSGTQAAGETITVRLTATSGGKTKQVTLTGIKVYGDPTLTVTNSTKDYINPDEFTATAWGASGTDTFGAATEITVSIDGEYKAGDIVTVVITSKDISGNTVTQRIENVKVYGNPVITYNIDKTAISINDTLSAELFGASAVDSFGESVAVVVSKYSGTLAAGNTVKILLKATDLKGNITEIYVSVQVYGAPKFTTATKTEFTVNDSVTAESLGITAKDTYGEALDITLTVKEGTWAAGGTVVYTASVTDVVGNTATLAISVKIYGTPTITVGRTSINVTEDPTVPTATVSFNLNGGSGSIASQTVTATRGLVYPEIPTRSGYVFRGWFTSSDCTTVYDFTANITGNITLYAGWQAMVTTYYSRNIIDITSNYNSSGSAYSFSNSGTSSSAYRYTYFTAYTSGTYRIYYKNSSSSSSYGTYCYIYNATTGTTIKSNANVYSTSYSSVSVTANAGDVIYIRNYRYSTSYSATFYLYVSGGRLPSAGGNAESCLNVSAKDSFRNELSVSVTLKSGSLTGGTTAVYTLTATDKLGNTATKDVTVKIYDQADIKLTYYNMASDLIKLTSRGEEFSASATDSFGNACTISIEAAKGFTLKGGNIISLYIVATDIMGNKTYSELITGIKVYDTPTITYNGEKSGSDYIIYNDTDLDFLFTVYDSFGEELYAEISTEDELVGGTYVYITVKATDDAGNVFEDRYRFAVISEEVAYVELYVNGEYLRSEFIEEGALSVPERNGYCFYGWQASDGTFCTDSDGMITVALSGYIKLNAVFYPEGYTPIATANELKNISMDGDYALVCDIDLGGAEWTPLGTSSSPFAGVFEGNGHTISNFMVTGIVQYAGLFGYNTGVIRNLGVENFTINITYSSDSSHAGGLVGYNSGAISNCYATGDVSSSSSASSNYIYSYAGGLVGYNYSGGTISNCYATGEVSSSSSASSRYSYAGGLVGRNNGTISNCYATGEVSASSSPRFGYSYAGGLVGRNYGTISNCYAMGVVSASISDSSSCNYAGGLVGYNQGGTISNCYATGEVSANSSSNPSDSSSHSDSYAGGLVGYNSGTISNCYATGDVSSSFSYSSSHNYSYAGGLVGDNYSGGTISNCYRYSGQTFTVNRNGTITIAATNTEGTAKSLADLQSVSFHTVTLGWDSAIWTFTEGTYPTLRI